MAATIFTLIILSIVVASVAWTATQEEVFAEIHDYCRACSQRSKRFFTRKFFYIFTCEYCFSHWVSLGVIILTGFKLIFDDWRGYVIAFFVLAWLANQWMSIYRRLRVSIKHESALAENAEDEVQNAKAPKAGSRR
jgi:hypothetical protein